MPHGHCHIREGQCHICAQLIHRQALHQRCSQITVHIKQNAIAASQHEKISQILTLRAQDRAVAQPFGIFRDGIGGQTLQEFLAVRP